MNKMFSTGKECLTPINKSSPSGELLTWAIATSQPIMGCKLASSDSPQLIETPSSEEREAVTVLDIADTRLTPSSNVIEKFNPENTPIAKLSIRLTDIIIEPPLAEITTIVEFYEPDRKDVTFNFIGEPHQIALIPSKYNLTDKNTGLVFFQIKEIGLENGTPYVIIGTVDTYTET